MLSNLFDSSFIAEDTNTSLASYFRTLRHNPTKFARLLAIFILPSMALGWWYYSLAMSVGAVAPLRSSAGSSEEITIPDSQNAPAAPAVNDTLTTDATNSASSSVSTDQINLNINSNAAQSSTVEVDGQSIPVPADGSTHQIIQNDNGKTTIDINVDSDTSGTSKTRSSTNINLRSSSSADLDIESEVRR